MECNAEKFHNIVTYIEFKPNSNIQLVLDDSLSEINQILDFKYKYKVTCSEKKIEIELYSSDVNSERPIYTIWYCLVEDTTKTNCYEISDENWIDYKTQRLNSYISRFMTDLQQYIWKNENKSKWS